MTPRRTTDNNNRDEQNHNLKILCAILSLKELNYCDKPQTPHKWISVRIICTEQIEDAQWQNEVLDCNDGAFFAFEQRSGIPYPPSNSEPRTSSELEFCRAVIFILIS